MDSLKYIFGLLGFGSKKPSISMQTNEQTTLIIEIKNSRPIELLSLTESMQAVGRQYVRFLNQSGVSVSETTRLYVKEVRPGSVIIELADLLPLAVPFTDIENWNSLLEFVKHLKHAYEYLLGRASKPDGEFQKTDWQNISSIVTPVAKDNASQINISGDFIYNRIYNFHFDHIEANAIQNSVLREVESLKTPVSGFHQNAVFYWHTIKNSKSGSPGERGVIESISRDPVKVAFDDDSVRNEMAFLENKNPMLSGYIVDVFVESINDKPALYRIHKLNGEV